MSELLSRPAQPHVGTVQLGTGTMENSARGTGVAASVCVGQCMVKLRFLIETLTLLYVILKFIMSKMEKSLIKQLL